MERFTTQDVQRWTGWTYQKARRTMIGYSGRGGVRYPGLLDKSPALTQIDQTAVDPEDANRDVRQRQLVFVFDQEIYRETRARGQVWIEDAASNDNAGACCQAADRPVDTSENGRTGGKIGNGGECSGNAGPCVNTPDDRARTDPSGGVHCVPDSVDSTVIDT